MKKTMNYEGQNTSSIFARCSCGQFLRLSRGEIFFSDGIYRFQQTRTCSRCKAKHDLITGMMAVSEDELQKDESRQIEEAAISKSSAEMQPRDRTVRCGRCGSDQITANTKGFGLGKAVAGGLAIGIFGLLAGFVGHRKTVVTCLKCGHNWVAGHRT